MAVLAVFYGFICFICSPVVFLFVLEMLRHLVTLNGDFSGVDMEVGVVCTAIVLPGLIWLIMSERKRAKRKGWQCRVHCLDGLPGFKREQITDMTLDLKNMVILMDGLKYRAVPAKHQWSTSTDDLKEIHVCLRFEQIVKLSYICWEGDVTRWKPGTNGFSYPGLFEGTREYVPPTSGYAYTEKLRVDPALEIQYRDQGGVPRRIVLDIRKDKRYAAALVESLCSYAALPHPQYVAPVEPSKPGPTYL